MKFVRSRSANRPPRTLSDAIVQGLAPDGGLFVPIRNSAGRDCGLDPAEAPPCRRWPTAMLAPFAEGDRLERDLAGDLPGSLRLSRSAGPARADCRAARASSSCFTGQPARSRISAPASLPRRWTRLRLARIAQVHRPGGNLRRYRAAPSRRPSIAGRGSDVVLLYPERPGLAAAGAAARVLGRERADVCRARHVRRLPTHRQGPPSAIPRLRATHDFSSANSINLGRLLPQMVYYAAASLQLWRSRQRKANFIVPSGNLGNVMACVSAARHGPADRRHRPGNERQSHGAGLPPRRRWRPRAGAGTSGADHGWPGATRGTPDGYTGIVSGFPPAALAALGDASGPARTGYPGQSGDDLTYQWAPDQNATPGPAQRHPRTAPAGDTGGAGSVPDPGLPGPSTAR